MRPGTPGFRKERLRAAREARSLTGAALAELADVTRSAISQYERGEQTPSPLVLQKIADALNLPQRHFLCEIGEVQSPVFYRSFASALKRSRSRAERRLEWLNEIVNYLASAVEFPEVNIPDASVDCDVLQLENDEIDGIATKVRRAWGLGDGPISNVVRLAEKNGIVVSRQFLDSEKLDAFSYWPNFEYNPLVVLSTDKECSVRSRFDLAHEIGHLVLHRHIKQRQLTNSKEFKRIEAQANRFAGAFLLPSQTFLSEIYSLTLEAFVAQKSRWRTSVALMIKRCEDTGVFTDDTSYRLWINLGRRGWRKREPLDDEIPIEEPVYLKRCIELLTTTGPSAIDTILSQLPWSPTEIETLLNLPNGMLQPDESAEREINPMVIQFPGVA